MKRKIAIIVMSDEHSGLALSGASHPWIRTPHIDKFAETATTFSSAYTNSPICIPARAAFTTSRYAHATRNWDNALPYTGETDGWTHILRNSGVDVTSIGKLHFRNESDDTGFSRQILPMHVVNGVGDLLGAVRDPLPVRNKSKSMAEQIGIGESTYTRYDRSIAAESLAWIEENKDAQSCVLFASFVAPHFPLISPEQFASLYQLDDIPLPKLCRAAERNDHPWIAALRACFTHDQYFDDDLRRRALHSYGGLCSFMDWHFGQLCQAIEQAGMADEAMIIYTSDHGDNMGSRGLWGKSTLYEEAARVPMFMRAPGRQLRSNVATHVSLVDVGPTLLDWFDIDTPADWPGQSLLDIAQRPDEPERVVFSEYHAAGAETGAFMVRQGPWKLIYYVDMPCQLFNLENDPEELADLAESGAYMDVITALTRELRLIVDPEMQDAQAKADQKRLVELHGGRDAIISVGGFGATPAPGTAPVFA